MLSVRIICQAQERLLSCINLPFSNPSIHSLNNTSPGSVTSSVQVLDACLKEITTALLQADVNVKLVMNLRTNVKTRAYNADKGAGLNKRKIIEKVCVLVSCIVSS